MRVSSRLRVALLLCPLLAAAAGFLVFAVQTPRFPYALDYGEGMILDEAWLLAEGHNIYPASPASPPYLIPSYPPLLMALEAPLTKAFGPAYWYGRLIAQISALAAAGALALVVLRLTGSPIAGLMTALTLLAIPAFTITSQLNRVDSLALALSSAALACAAMRSSRKRLAGAGVLLLAAGFTRQTAWMAPGLAIVAHLASRGERKAAVILSVATALAALVVVAALQAASGGFLFAITRSAATRMSIAHGVEVVGPNLPTMALFVAALVVTIAAGIRRRAAWAPLLLAYAVGVMPEIAAAVNVGSSANYLFGLSAASALGVGCAWSLLNRDGRARVRWTGTLLLAAQAAFCAWLDRPFRLAPAPYLAQLERTIAATRGPVLADDVLGLLPPAGKHIVIEPFKMSELARAGKWDERPFVADLEHRRFALIVLGASAGGTVDRGPWTDEAWRAIAANYRPCGSVAIDRARRLQYYRPSDAPCGAEGDQ